MRPRRILATLSGAVALLIVGSLLSSSPMSAQPVHQPTATVTVNQIELENGMSVRNESGSMVDALSPVQPSSTSPTLPPTPTAPVIQSRTPSPTVAGRVALRYEFNCGVPLQTSYAEGLLLDGDVWHVRHEVWLADGTYGLSEFDVFPQYSFGWFAKTIWFTSGRMPVRFRSSTSYTQTDRVMTSRTEESLCPQIQEAPNPAIIQQLVLFTGFQAGDGVEYTWDYGDGADRTGVTSTHVYTAPGLYTVWLTTTNWSGTVVNSTTVTVTLPLPPVITSAFPPIMARQGERVTIFGENFLDGISPASSLYVFFTNKDTHGTSIVAQPGWQGVSWEQYSVSFILPLPAIQRGWLRVIVASQGSNAWDYTIAEADFLPLVSRNYPPATPTPTATFPPFPTRTLGPTPTPSWTPPPVPCPTFTPPPAGMVKSLCPTPTSSP